MLRLEDAQYITDAIAPLADPLHAGFDHGGLIAQEHYDQYGMKGRAYYRGRTDLARDHARRHLASLDLGEWKLQPTASGRILLARDAMTVRVLHGVPFGDAPAPGENKARISYYRNPAADLFGVEGSRLLAVWETNSETGALSIRILRPTDKWKPWQAAKADFDAILPRNSQDLSKLEFVPSDEDFLLPFVFEDEEVEEGETGGA